MELSIEPVTLVGSMNSSGGVDFGQQEINWEKVERIFEPEKKNVLEKLSGTVDKYPLAKDVLLLLAATGAISLAVLMPGLAKVLGSAVRAQRKGDFRRRLHRLERRKLIEVTYDEKGEPVVKITQDGLERALRYKFEVMKIKKPKVWDKKWRVVIFDVPEGKKRMRDQLREKLRHLDFYALNKSVFVHPFPCFDEIEFLRQVFLIGGEVTYLVAEKIENQERLLRWFELDSD